ncbi:MAG: DinB family protein [Ktedonobacterales bacterium]
MPHLSRKTEILEQISATHLLLEAHLSAFDDSQMLQPGVNGDWTVKDLVAHITWWEQHLLRRLAGGRDDLYQEGISVQDATDQANAVIFAANQPRLLSEILNEFHDSYREVLAAVEALTEEDVAMADTYEAIAWDTFRHYPEHTAMLQAWFNRATPDEG